jgi:hypothetical protein
LGKASAAAEAHSAQVVGTLTGGDNDDGEASIDEDSDDGQAFLSDEEGAPQQGGYYQVRMRVSRHGSAAS